MSERVERGQPNRIPDLSNGILSALLEKGHNYSHLSDMFDDKVQDYSVYSQEATGYCWLLSALIWIGDYVQKKYNCRAISFSKEYLMFYDKYERADLFLDRIIKTLDQEVTSDELKYITARGISDRGQFNMAKALIQKYGLVPEYDKKNLPACNNTGELNACLSMILRNDAYILRKMHSKGARFQEISQKKNDMIGEIKKILISCMGSPPSSVTIPNYVNDAGGTLTDPLSFYNEYIEFPFEECISLVNDGNTKELLFVEDIVDVDGFSLRGSYNSYLHVTSDLFFASINNQLGSGIPCWIGCDAGKFSFWKIGVFDDSLIDFSKVTQYMNDEIFEKKVLNEYHLAAMTHSMLLLDKADDSRMTWWRALNTSKASERLKGVAYCSQRWFQKYVFQAVILKRHLPPMITDRLHVIDTRLVQPWDLSYIY